MASDRDRNQAASSPAKTTANVTPTVQRKLSTLNDLVFAQDIRSTPAALQRTSGGNTMARDWIKSQHQGPYDRKYGTQNQGENYNVKRGQLTFDSEGTEGGRFHSRTPHLPPGASGVTIGRGFDIGQHTAEQSRGALIAAGLSPEQASAYAGAARKKSGSAREWLDENRAGLGEITPEQQKSLFNSTYAEMSADVQHISNNNEDRYGPVSLPQTDPGIRDTLVDLRYRGDYRTGTRPMVQGLAARNDTEGLARVMSDRSKWPNVPPDRFERRAAYAQQTAEQARIERNLPYTFHAPFEQVGNPKLGFDGRPRPEKPAPENPNPRRDE